MITALPHFLDKGIYLEDSDALLGWNSSRSVLIQIAQPQTKELPGGRAGLLWCNRRDFPPRFPGAADIEHTSVAATGSNHKQNTALFSSIFAHLIIPDRIAFHFK
jgi:hypothetical protein